MKDENIFEDRSSMNVIINSLWSAFSTSKFGPLFSDDYHSILLLLSLYKDSYFDRFPVDFYNINYIHVKDLIENLIKESTDHRRDEYLQVYKVFEPKIQNLSNSSLFAIIRALFSIDKMRLSENFAEIFDNILYQIAKSQGKLSGEYVQPVELTRFICHLAILPEKATVFNPFAGVASFAVFLNNDINYYGQEIFSMPWAIGTLRLLAHEKQGTFIYVKEDSILHWPDDNRKFDLIVANPPHGFHINNSYKDISPDTRTAEHFFVRKGVSSLSEKGKLIAILSSGFLFKGGHELHLRKYLIESDLIESIISLPSGLLMNTGVPIVVLVINKDKLISGKVRFVDAKKFVKSKSQSEKYLDDEALILSINNNEESDSLRFISTEQIREKDYSLYLPKYLQREFEGIRLSEIGDIIHGNRDLFPEMGKLVRIRDLKDDKFEYFLDENSIEDSELKRSDLRSIKESCLLLSLRWKTLKPTYFRFKGITIYLPQDILALNVNESIANTAYLISELHSDYVQEQLESNYVGETIPYIAKDDLLNIKVKLPSRIEQIAKFQGLEELTNKIKLLREERNALAHEFKSYQFKEFSSLKHTLGRPRQNILDWSDNLFDFFSKRSSEIEGFNKAFADFYDIDILAALKEIKNDINYMTEILEKGENGLVLSEYPLKLISLSDVNSIINELALHRFIFRIEKHLIKGEKLKELGIECNSTLLKTLIDNILTNANKYAFSEKEANNLVIIELNEVEEFLILEIKNNGEPFPKNFDKEKFIIKYSTANPKKGSGLGGYDINRIAEYFHNPNWELILNDDPIFPVRFKFQFTIKLIK